MSAGVGALKGAQLYNEIDSSLLKRAINIQADFVSQMLQSIPNPPQAEGSGTVVDTYA
jgi:hypothetical protein